jgi:acetylornithine deacetylase/succinyl-diaminopimelate desuccinylase-like protein
MTLAPADLGAALARAAAAVSEAQLREAMAALMSRPSPPDGERPLAEDLAERGRRAHPDLRWEVDALDERSANLVARSAHRGGDRELVLYAHLDTSLAGDPARDLPITGEPRQPVPFRVDEGARAFRGLGVGVAKAPAAAAIVAFTAAAAVLREHAVPHRLTLLLAAGGTHRAAPRDAPAALFGRGVRHALASGWRPSAVLNVKGGPAGVLHEEPAAAYLRVRLRAPWSAALMRRSAAPEGGLARHAGTVLDAIESWRASYLREHPGAGQLASEIAIGAVRSGAPDKPDLLPGLLEVFVYAVLLPDEDPERVARQLAASLRPRLATVPGHPTVEVDVYASGPGGRTDPAGEVVRLAEAAWAAEGGESAPVTAWTGATDGGIFLAAGIPTARLGVTVSRDPADARIEVVALDELLRAARAYVDVAVRYCAGATR